MNGWDLKRRPDRTKKSSGALAVLSSVRHSQVTWWRRTGRRLGEQRCWINTYNVYVYIYICTVYIYICTYMCICIYVYMYICVYLVGGFNHLEKYESQYCCMYVMIFTLYNFCVYVHSSKNGDSDLSLIEQTWMRTRWSWFLLSWFWGRMHSWHAECILPQKQDTLK